MKQRSYLLYEKQLILGKLFPTATTFCSIHICLLIAQSRQYKVTINDKHHFQQLFSNLHRFLKVPVWEGSKFCKCFWTHATNFVFWRSTPQWPRHPWWWCSLARYFENNFCCLCSYFVVLSLKKNIYLNCFRNQHPIYSEQHTHQAYNVPENRKKGNQEHENKKVVNEEGCNSGSDCPRHWGVLLMKPCWWPQWSSSASLCNHLAVTPNCEGSVQSWAFLTFHKIGKSTNLVTMRNYFVIIGVASSKPTPHIWMFDSPTVANFVVKLLANFTVYTLHFFHTVVVVGSS